ncbi:MAG: NAD(+) synthase [Myxococcales bacterium]|nr:NAD(+) synthase [Myxococcales bacterium]
MKRTAGLGSRLKALARSRLRNLGRVRELSRRFRSLSRYDSPEALELIIEWTRERLVFARARRAVFGASGGVDSSLVACILARAYPGRCLGLILPCESEPEDEHDASTLLEALGIERRRIDLAPALAALRALLSPVQASSTAEGNLKTRLRTLALFHEASARKGLFVGTGDLDEGFVGYYTKGSGSDLSPIASLHKHEVRALLELALWPVNPKLARRLSRKPAHAGLVRGRSAEAELGVPYEHIARCIEIVSESCNLYEVGVAPREVDEFDRLIARTRMDERTFLRVAELIYRARHKAEGSPVLWRDDPGRSTLDDFSSE